MGNAIRKRHDHLRLHLPPAELQRKDALPSHAKPNPPAYANSAASLPVPGLVVVILVVVGHDPIGDFGIVDHSGHFDSHGFQFVVALQREATDGAI